jgi:hypothetical protein
LDRESVSFDVVPDPVVLAGLVVDTLRRRWNLWSATFANFEALAIRREVRLHPFLLCGKKGFTILCKAPVAGPFGERIDSPFDIETPCRPVIESGVLEADGVVVSGTGLIGAGLAGLSAGASTLPTPSGG